MSQRDRNTQKLPPAFPSPVVARAPSVRLKLVVALTIALCVGGALILYRYQNPPWRDMGLPPRPSLVGKTAELKEALADAEMRAVADRGAPASLAKLAQVYHANGFLTEAAVCWQILQKAQPNEGRWCYYLADLRRSIGDEEGFRSWLVKAVKFAPDYAPAWLQLAELDFKAGRLDAAEQGYQRRLSLLPGDPYASLGLARIAIQRGQIDEGTRQIVTLVRKHPDFQSSHNIYAQILTQAGDDRGAAEQRRIASAAGRFRSADDPWLEELHAECFDIERLMQLAEIDFQTKLGDRGVVLMDRAIRLDSKNPLGYERLGSYYTDAKEPAKAVAILEAGSKLPNPRELLFSNLCDAYNALHQPADELRAADTGLKSLPKSSVLHNARAHALLGLNRLDEAVAEYRIAIELAPSAADPVTNLGYAYLRLNRTEAAVASFKQALKLQPLFRRAVVPLASLEIEKGDLKSAATLVSSLYEEDPSSVGTQELVVKIYLHQAMVAVRREDSAQVELICRQGLALYPESSEIMGFLGAYFVQQGRLGDATKMLEDSHRLHPADPRVAFALGDLYVRLNRIEDARLVLTEGSREAREIGETSLIQRCDDLLAKLPR